MFTRRMTADPIQQAYLRRVEAFVVGLRWASMAFVLAFVHFLVPRGAMPHLGWFDLLVSAAAAFNLAITWVLWRRGWSQIWSYAAVVVDIAMLTVACAMTGGLVSNFRYMYFVTMATVPLRFDLGPSLALIAVYVGMYAALARLGGDTRPVLLANLMLTFAVVAMTVVEATLAQFIIRSRADLERIVEERTAELAAQSQELAAQSQELAAANESLQQLDRLKADFVNSITHELRTPLTAIRGYAEFLEDEIGGPLTAEHHAFVDQIEKGEARLRNLVDELLDFARMDAGTFRLKLARADLRGKATEIVESLKAEAIGADVRLDLSLPKAPVMRTVDLERIGQVLGNLLSNAIKFTPAGGTVVVRLEDGPWARFEVADSGPGIDPEDIPKLFNRFAQLDRGAAKGGTGLGLSISKALVEAHGGAIGVESQPGQGSTFWFSLPADDARQGVPEAPLSA